MNIAQRRFFASVIGGIGFALAHAGLQRLRAGRVDPVLAALSGALFAAGSTALAL